MAQNYDDNAPAWGNPTDSDVAKIKNNFEALKSTFSGASQPPNPVAGMWWYDTTAHILKVRNEANNAWLSVWDLANNKPSNEITLDMMAASAKSPAAGVEGLRKLGTGALDAMPGNATPPDGSISQSKLKTSSGSVSVKALATQAEGLGYYGAAVAHTILPGGEYGFSERSYVGGTADGMQGIVLPSCVLAISGSGSAIKVLLKGDMGFYNTSAAANVALGARVGSMSQGTTARTYATQRYITASGEVFWVFILRDRETGQEIASWVSPEHPCFGNSGDPLIMPHPFYDYDPAIHEIVVCNPENGEVGRMRSRVRKGGCLAELIHDEYRIDESRSAPWPTEKVAVGLPPEYDWVMAQQAIIKDKSVPVERVSIPQPPMVVCRSLRLK